MKLFSFLLLLAGIGGVCYALFTKGHPAYFFSGLVAIAGGEILPRVGHPARLPREPAHQIARKYTQQKNGKTAPQHRS